MFDTLLVKQFTINNNVYYLQIHSSYYEKFLATGEVKCIDDEIPFEIPQGWEWERIGNIFETTSGSTPLSRNPDYYKNGNINWVRTTDLNNGILNRTEIQITAKATIDYNLSILPQTSVCIAMYGGAGTIGKHCILHFNTTINQSVCAIQPNGFCNMDYIHTFIEYQRPFWMDFAAGSRKDPNINQLIIKHCLLPIPPQEEQRRIVTKLNQLYPYINQYGNSQNRLNQINKEIWHNLKKSILQEAIQGKLVPQIAEEGIAQDLLEQIRQEKQKLVKEGKLKKSALTDSVIYKGDDNKYFEKNGKIEKDITNEIPFEIPDTWAWSRLSNLVILLSGRDLEPTQYNSVSKGIPYMTGASNFRNGSLIKNRWTETPIVISILGDLLITCKGTIGEMSFNTIGDIHIARQIMALRSNFVNLKYIQDYLSANIQDLQKQANSMIPGISRDTLLNALVPLPPLIEQARIVSKIKQLASIMKE